MFGLISLVVFVIALSGRVLCIVDYCAQNTYASNSTWLQFNKEASSCEYAIEQRFKGLHCCAKGYRSIEWYKDNRAYPWPSGVSNMILYPESTNQTIYTQMVTASDTGNYTCVLRNDTHVRAHTIHLHVFSKVPDAPKITYKPKSQQVEVGQSVRLFCEAFVGRIDLPDAHNDATWRRTDQNGSIEDQPGKHLVKVPREDNVTLGVYLVIEEVTEEDFGEYTCRITKPDDRYIDINVTLSEKVIVEQIVANPVPWKKITVIIAVLLLLVVTIVVVNMQYGLAARVWFKDRFEPIEDGDGKLSDLLICYNQKDAEIVLGVLIPKLESKYHYKCSSREFSSNVNYWHVEMAEAARKTRRIVAVLSPATLNDNWDCGSLYQALKQLQALGPPLNCVALKAMPYSATQTKNAQGETLTTILRNIHVILWERASDDRFWLALRLNLPAKRCQTRPQTTDNICLNTTTANNSTTRLNNCNSGRGSLENLV